MLEYLDEGRGPLPLVETQVHIIIIAAPTYVRIHALIGLVGHGETRRLKVLACGARFRGVIGHCRTTVLRNVCYRLQR